MSERRTTAIREGTWRHDFLASIVVFLVALPLCMGIAIASGVPTENAAAVGILTGVVGGIVVGLFAGSPLLVTGPAAGLSVLVFDLVQRFGWASIGLIVAIAGGLQLVAGLLRLGQWFRAVSPAVIHGMLAGIGVLILASQFHIMLDDGPRENGIQNIVSIPGAIWRGIVPTENASHDTAARIGVLTILILIFWKKLAPARLKLVPAPLVAVTAATLVTAAMNLPIKQVALPDTLTSAITWPSIAELTTWSAWQPILVAALSIAFIASAETLLSASAVDQMHNGPRTRYDRELVAQGLGNMVSGVLGGLPMTGVIVRSAANVQAGAKSAKSEILHAVWLLMFVVLFPSVLRLIPTASLAAILVYTGFKLVNLSVVRELQKFGRSEVLIYFATMTAIVAFDLLTGVIAGFALSILKLLATFSHLVARIEDEPHKRRSTLYLEGTATFLRLPRLASRLEAIPEGRELHVNFQGLDYIDHACLDLLMNWSKQHAASGGSLVIDWESLTARFRPPGEVASNSNGGAGNQSSAGAALGGDGERSNGRHVAAEHRQARAG